MTDGTSQPMVFGDIHELLRKVNGESQPAYMWQSDKSKEEVKPEEPSQAPEQRSQKDDKEKPPSTDNLETDKEQKPVAESSQKEKPRKSKAKPSPSKTEKEDEKAAEKVKERSNAKISALPSKENIQAQIESFSYAIEKGHRHWVYLPDEVFVTLEIVYGRNRLSAIFTALAKAFIDANKDELRQLIAHRTNLLQ
jgi:DNA mismatch repair ATPase MutL